MVGGPSNQVSHLLVDSNWRGNLNCFPNHITQDIQNIKIQQNSNKDFWFWLPKGNGCFDFKSTWNQIRKKSTELDWCKVIRNNKCAPKMSRCG